MVCLTDRCVALCRIDLKKVLPFGASKSSECLEEASNHYSVGHLDKLLLAPYSNREPWKPQKGTDPESRA